jgi:hypothetical protein
VSQENVEIVRRAIEAFNRGDFDAALENVSPDATVDWSHSRGPDPTILLSTYAHLLPRSDTQAAQTVAAILADKPLTNAPA